MRKWVANEDFLMEDIINYVYPEKDYLIIRQVQAGSFIYEYENIDKVVVNRYEVQGAISQGWKKLCSVVGVEAETPWGETGGSGGGDDSFVAMYRGIDLPGMGENQLEVGQSKIWYDENSSKKFIVARVTEDEFVQVELT